MLSVNTVSKNVSSRILFLSFQTLFLHIEAMQNRLQDEHPLKINKDMMKPERTNINIVTC